jgi:hypothetical protein
MSNDTANPDDDVAAGAYVVPETADIGTLEVKLID